MKSRRLLAASIVLTCCLAGLMGYAGSSSAQCMPDPPSGSRMGGDLALAPGLPSEDDGGSAFVLMTHGRFLEAAARLWVKPLLRPAPAGANVIAESRRIAIVRSNANKTRVGAR